MRWLLLVAIAACHRGEGAACGQVGQKFQTLALADLAAAKADEVTITTVANQIPALRDSLVAFCKDDAWSAQVRDCMAAATDHLALQACEAQLTDDQRKALAKGTSVVNP
jgi:hypothetical protein